jgi:hypothetical protein
MLFATLVSIDSERVNEEKLSMKRLSQGPIILRVCLFFKNSALFSTFGTLIHGLNIFVASKRAHSPV